jgi:hypothetical protein
VEVISNIEDASGFELPIPTWALTRTLENKK